MRARSSLLAATVGCALGLALAACGGDDPAAAVAAPITAATGEIHLHEFPLGAHAWAAFLAVPIPLAQIHSDQVVDLELPPTRREGACALYVEPRCVPACLGRTYCTGENACSPFHEVTYVDGGDLTIDGSRLVPRIRIFYDAAVSNYASDPPPGDALLFAGGERLHVAGGKAGYAMAGDIPAPRPVVVLAPDLAAPLRLPGDAPLVVRWQPEGGESVVVTVGASAGESSSAYVRCVAPDVGMLTVPQSMMAALPGPPRDTRIEIERDEQRLLPTARPGIGVLTHAAFSAWANGAD